MSVVTYAELRHGTERCPPTDRAAAAHSLERFIARVPVLHFDERAAESHGVLAPAVRDRNRDTMDRLIAAHAVSVGITLVTNNEADFKDYRGLVAENWVSAPATKATAKTQAKNPKRKFDPDCQLGRKWVARQAAAQARWAAPDGQSGLVPARVHLELLRGAHGRVG